MAGAGPHLAPAPRHEPFLDNDSDLTQAEALPPDAAATERDLRGRLYQELDLLWLTPSSRLDAWRTEYLAKFPPE